MDATDILELSSPPISTITKVLPTNLMSFFFIFKLRIMESVWGVCVYVYFFPQPESNVYKIKDNVIRRSTESRLSIL